jgi:hypothetical protein
VENLHVVESYKQLIEITTEGVLHMDLESDNEVSILLLVSTFLNFFYHRRFHDGPFGESRCMMKEARHSSAPQPTEAEQNWPYMSTSTFVGGT